MSMRTFLAIRAAEYFELAFVPVALASVVATVAVGIAVAGARDAARTGAGPGFTPPGLLELVVGAVVVATLAVG